MACGVMSTVKKQNEMNEKPKEYQAFAFSHHFRIRTFQLMACVKKVEK